MSVPAWSVTTYEGIDGLETIEPLWRPLESARPFSRAYHGYDAAFAYARHLAPEPSTLRFHVVMRDGAACAIVAVERRVDRSLFVPMRLRGIPWPWEWPLGDVIAADDQAAEKCVPLVLEAMRGDGLGGPLLVVGPLPSDSAVWNPTVSSASLVAQVRPQGAWDYIETTGGYAEYLAGLRKNFRGNLRKARNKLAATPGVEFLCATDGDSIARELEAFMQLEASGWKASDPHGRPISTSDKACAWYREWTGRMASQGRCEINALYLDGRVVASQLCTITGDAYEIHKIAYDEGYARLAPGNLLLEHTLQRCFESTAIRVVDLMSDTPWHRDWGVCTRPMSVGLIARSAFGRVLVPVARFRYGPLRRAVRALASRGR